MKDKIITIIFLIYVISFSILHVFIKDLSFSTSERRKLSSFPKFELTNEYVTKIDKYLLDHFPYRDNFRSIKAIYNYDLLNKYDNNDIYLKDNYIFKSNYPTNVNSINNFINNIEKTKKLLNENNNTFIMIIPDKNYYLSDFKFLSIDYDYIYENIDKLKINSIDIRKIMELNDYYETDTHWKQENLDKVVKKIGDVIGFDYSKENYALNKYNNFYGVYYGESAINRNAEELIYLTNDEINNAKVKYFENKELSTVYNLDNLSGLDPYEVYLDGASAFIEIFNENAGSNKELVIFRDSFGSSISPLLIKYYSKITLIDNRYIGSKNYLDMIEFNNQDVLFMYSTLLVNDSFSLKN